jgi:hypothetical protein
MDEASKLVSELQSKLAELDHKVWQYRRDMTTEFTKYAEGVLRDVPKDVSETVNKVIAESIKDHRSLYPDATNTIESCATGTNVLANGAGNDISSSHIGGSTLPPHYHMQESETEEGPRSPHEREKEFQGLFTPSYLPLLDSTSHERRSSYSPPTTPPLNKIKVKEMDALHVDASTDTRSLAPSPELQRPPTPKRRNTDEVSIASDYSDGPVRRSALRRSSSSSKGHSPRRVRFDVEGEEVLPTASLLPEQTILATDIPPSSIGLEDSDDEVESEQVEDIDAPPPKRISSSQALRALSRGPFEDDGTKWTTVSAPPDGSASVATVNGLSQNSLSEDLQITNSFSRPTSENSRGPLHIPEAKSSSAYNTFPNKASENNTSGDEDSKTFSDDEMLDMPPLRTVRGPGSLLLPSNFSSMDENKSPTALTRPPSKPWLGLESFETSGDRDGDMKFLDEDEEELFQFDENNDQRSLPEEEQESEPESPISPVAQTEPVTLSHYSSSPARGIAKPNAPRSINPASKGVVGSYKSHPFNMPIVSDEIHARAASLGDINSFVGSVDGRSGIDESDGRSFRTSGGIGSFSGAPRSMTERMMMDDLVEAEEVRQK